MIDTDDFEVDVIIPSVVYDPFDSSTKMFPLKSFTQGRIAGSFLFPSNLARM